MNAVLITLGALNLAATGTLIFALLQGKKQMEKDLEEVRNKASKSAAALRNVLDDLNL